MMVELAKRNTGKIAEPQFRDESELTVEQLTDPDYALKQLAKLAGNDMVITCSKCHHCR